LNCLSSSGYSCLGRLRRVETGRVLCLTGLSNGRGIERRVNSKRFQHITRKTVMRTIDPLRHQNMVTGLEQSNIYKGNCGLAAGREYGSIPMLQFANPSCEFKGGRRSVQAVVQAAIVPSLILIPAIGDAAALGNTTVEPLNLNTGEASDWESPRHLHIGVNKLGLPILGPSQKVIRNSVPTES
jgi:hypothetical protein